MTRLYKFADDSMMGRLAGTPWNDKGTDYIAAEVKRLGLTPAGDDGYFQHPLVSKAFADSSWIAVGGKRYALWKDFAPRYQGDTVAVLSNAPVVFGGTWGDTASYLPNDQATGKVVVIRLAKKPDGTARTISSSTARSSPAASPTRRRSPSSSSTTCRPATSRRTTRAPSVGVKPDAEEPVRHVPSVLLRHDRARRRHARRTPRAGEDRRERRARVDGHLHQTTGVAPGRNVLAILPGSDPRLRGEFVVIGAHDDHIGFNQTPADHDSVKAVMMHAAPQGADSPDPKPTPEQWAKIRVTMDSLRKLHPSRPDSIYNGADDDGSGSMALLEIAERFATAAGEAEALGHLRLARRRGGRDARLRLLHRSSDREARLDRRGAQHRHDRPRQDRRTRRARTRTASCCTVVRATCSSSARGVCRRSSATWSSR